MWFMTPSVRFCFPAKTITIASWLISTEIEWMIRLKFKLILILLHMHLLQGNLIRLWRQWKKVGVRFQSSGLRLPLPSASASSSLQAELSWKNWILTSKRERWSLFWTPKAHSPSVRPLKRSPILDRGAQSHRKGCDISNSLSWVCKSGLLSYPSGIKISIAFWNSQYVYVVQ